VANKLGPRKAASQHHVPRSILVNRLYTMQHDLDQDADGDEPEDSNDDGEAEVDSNASTPAPSYPDFARSQLRKLSHLSEHNGSDLGEDLDRGSPKMGRHAGGSSASATPGALPSIPLDANVLLHTLMLAAGIGAMPKLDETQTVGDLIKGLLVANSGGMMNEGLLNLLSTSQENSNGNASLLLQQQHQQQQHHQQQQQQHVAAYRHRLPKSETPETNSSLDANDASEDPILKIPSFKVSGPTSSSSLSPGHHPHHHPLNNNNSLGVSNNSNHSSSNSHRNGSNRSPHSASPMLAAAVAQGGGYSGANSLLASSSSSIQKMMASNIQRQINEQSGQDGLRNGNVSDCSSNNGGGGSSSSLGYKKPSISVAKIIGGTDTSRFGASPNLLSQGHHQGHHLSHHQQQQQQQLSAQEAAALAAGKGTRPKRGKYRNYDRDSLVEAVKAVQRGEMSVHRAGSYYGVPHSTLDRKKKGVLSTKPKREVAVKFFDGPAKKYYPRSLNPLTKIAGR